MNILRPVLAIVGIIFIVLFYIFQNVLFLAAAVILFAIGLFLMGAFRRPKSVPSSDNRARK